MGVDPNSGEVWTDPSVWLLDQIGLNGSDTTLQKSGNSPFIVAHKRVSHRKLKSDLGRVSVSIDIYNAGSDAAYDVTLTDDSWAEEVFDSIIGNTSKTWERLDSGSLVSHSFELESKVKTVYYGAPALITYRIPTKSKLQRLLAKYGSHVSVFLIVALFANILTAPKTSGNKKKH
ncbi:hypothetical protein DH2020_038446 [Rehmannia glutinosa]|uniref:Uncharacterized protein n=1 Tax=Rehmannia glutinosa TaxID=99300 RepID=A0ABR0UYI2_REHGL